MRISGVYVHTGIRHSKTACSYRGTTEGVVNSE